jgi:glutamate--cysteine ligase
MLTALPALFGGIFYEPSALDAAWDLVKAWDSPARENLRQEVPRFGLETRVNGRSLREIGVEVLQLARSGLAKRKLLNAKGHDETIYLEPLEAILRGKSEAERLIGKFKSDWAGSVEPAFTECVF